MAVSRTISLAATALLTIGTVLAAACSPSAAPAGQPASSGAAPTAGQAQPAPDKAPPPLTKGDVKRPELLMETDALASGLASKDLRIIDVRAAGPYGEAHIPGAINLNPNDLDTKKPNGVQDLAAPGKVAEVLSNLGLGDSGKIVVYDDQRTLSAARVFWALDFLGRKDVAVLNGGFPKWQAEKREVTRTVPKLDKAVFTPHPDSSKVADVPYIKANMSDKSVVLCDARTPGEYDGTDVRAERGGHIPGAKNVNWENNIQSGETPVLKDAAQLKALYDQAGITPDREVITYCQSGVRAAQSYFTLKLLGYEKVRNFDGSWQEWAKDASLPIEGNKK